MADGIEHQLRCTAELIRAAGLPIREFRPHIAAKASPRACLRLALACSDSVSTALPDREHVDRGAGSIEMAVKKLLWSHRYAEAMVELRRILDDNPEDIAAVEGMAKALRGIGQYREALSFFERLAIHERGDKTANILAPGRAAWQIDIACLYWLVDDRRKAIQLMHRLVAGILDGSIKYGDAAGGTSQGTLLYYMAITDRDSGEAAFALDYLKGRIKRSINKVWPSPITEYYLGDVKFEKVLEAANRQPALARSPDPKKIELSRRRRLSVALFHDGVRSRVQGDEGHCLARMRECCSLENPLIEQEWYLARYEVQKADSSLSGHLHPPCG